MTPGLTARQVEALDAYDELRAGRPALFTGRRARPIVTDRGLLERYAAEHAVVLGVTARTAYTLFVVDLVASGGPAKPTLHPYERCISQPQLAGGVNTVVLGVVADPRVGDVGSIVFVEQERHAFGGRLIELPRGFGEPGLSGERNALRELAEETGYAGDAAVLLARTTTDSGVGDSVVAFYLVPVVRRAAAAPEIGEAIRTVHLIDQDVAWDAVFAGRIRDGFTVQALGLLGRRGSPPGGHPDR